MKEKCPLKNEDGFVLILTLIMMVLLTLLGVSSTRTSSIEIQISGNEKVYKENLYMAEAGSIKAGELIADGGAEMTDPADENWPTWLYDEDNPDTEEDLNDGTAWTGEHSQPVPASIDPDQQTRFLVIYKGLHPGVSLDVSKAHMYDYECYGRCSRNKGVVIIRVGYSKVFL